MRILIWGEMKNGGPYDIFRQLDYKSVFTELQKEYSANFTNVGNKVWIQGLVSSVSTDENEIFFYNPKESWEEINNKYDKIIYSAANMFSPYYKSLIKQVATIFRNSKIPIYVLSIGAQADDYSEIKDLVKEIKNETSLFLDSIYASGGEIACRGYFTKEFLDCVAYNTAEVLGCPSLFQNGRNLFINKSESINKIAFNGNYPFSYETLSLYPNSVYIDQDIWLRYSYDLNYKNKLSHLIEMVSCRGRNASELFLKDKVKTFFDVTEWRNYLINNKFDLSIGSRIHGNIMALLCGIPSVVCPIDSRTRELADYFNIPTINWQDYENINKVYYCADFDRFNNSFPDKFDKYESFLKKYGLANHANQENSFWSKKDPINSELIETNKKQLLKEYNKWKSLIWPCSIIKRRIDRMNNHIIDIPTFERYEQDNY